MNRPSQRSQRVVLAGLLLAIIITAMVAPNIIDIYTGAPRIQAPAADGLQVFTPLTESSRTFLKGASIILDRATQTPTSGPQSPSNCTLPIEYWRSHSDSWPSQGMTFGGLVLDKETALGVINSTAEDVQIIVLKELIVYSLNSLHGADPSPIIAAVKELGSWLAAHGSAESVPEPERQRGLALAASLGAFNQGQTGPGLCPETIDTPTPTLTSTSPPTLSPTASLTNTSPPPTRQPPVFFPTATSRPNPPNPPPTEPPPPPPTAAPTQPPPPPPTAAPTQPPPPTAVPTSIPTPTSPP